MQCGLTKQDILAVRDPHLNSMFSLVIGYTAYVVCGKCNASLFGGSLKPRNFTRGARCYICQHPEEGGTLKAQWEALPR
ncbi:MAG: hypothetical protein KGI26_04785 [Thaumarchaeota archaeon]|nr:hypothetical protein [Nitrososphaerota archaeon]